MTRAPSPPRHVRRVRIAAELGLPSLIAAAGALGYVAFPDDLAFLSRLVGLCFLVLSLDLVTGYCGIATLGQAALFGVAAYAVGNACLGGLVDPVALLLVGAASGAAMGALSGSLIALFSGLPQLVLSIAIGQLVGALANSLSMLTGGSDGLSGISPGPVFGLFAFDIFSKTTYVLSIVVLTLVTAALMRLVRSPFGLLCRGIRDDALRAKMLGASVYPRLVLMYTLSGAVAGLGGALTAMTAGVVGLDGVSFERSAEALVMLVLGGAGTIWGAIAGSIAFQVFEHIVSANNPFHWLILVGLLLILIVVFAPQGLIGAATTWSAKLRRRSTDR